MKILVIDMIYPFGHKGLNRKLVNILTSFSEVILLDYQNYYDGLKTNNNLSLVEIKKPLLFSENKFLKRIYHCLNIIRVKRSIFRKNYDAVLVMTHENISFSLMRFLLNGKPIFIIHHNTIDLLNGKLNKYFFKKYMNSVNHIVFADFIKEGIIKKTNVNAKKVKVLEHPLSNNIPMQIDNSINNGIIEKTFLSLGLGSDEELIKKLVRIEKESQYFTKNGLNLIIRSVKINFESPGLKIFTGILSEDEYFELYKKASVYLLLYPISYQLRFSGSILNALQSGKCVIGTNIPLVRYFSKLYPNNCRVAKSIEDLLMQLTTSDFRFDAKEYENFKSKHSDANVRLQMEKIFKSNNDLNMT